MNVAVKAMQCCNETRPEVKKMSVNDQEFTAGRTPNSASYNGVSAQVQKCLTAFKQMLRPRYDLERLNARLRRDAGIDEHEMERNKLVKAPLIR